jgi:hypothetical protein
MRFRARTSDTDARRHKTQRCGGARPPVCLNGSLALVVTHPGGVLTLPSHGSLAVIIPSVVGGAVTIPSVVGGDSRADCRAVFPETGAGRR